MRADDVVGRMGGEEFVLDPARRRRGGRRGLRRARPRGDRGADRPRAGRSRRPRVSPQAPSTATSARPARERRLRAVLRQALRPRADRAATSPAAIRPRGEQRNEVAALLARGTSAIEIVVQPVVELATGRAGGYEALTRIHAEPRRGPDEWFAQAHRVGLGDELEALAMRAALAVPDRPEGTFLALNVSPRALLSAPVQATLPEDLTGIVVELTEHELFGAEGELETALAELRAAARGSRSTTPARATRACSR